jgi:hypothetical protein
MRTLVFKPGMVCFYALQGISLMVMFDENWCMDLIGIFPGVVAFRVTLPFDEILQGLAMSPSPMATDLFHFIFFLSINQIRGRLGEVWPM